VLKDLTTDKEVIVHVKRIRPFFFDPNSMDPREIALRGTGLYDVEEIVSHHGDTRRVLTLDFLVRWRGRDEVENKWVKWAAVRNNLVLHKYLYKNNMRQLIPSEHIETVLQEECKRLEDTIRLDEAREGLEEIEEGESQRHVEMLQNVQEQLRVEKVKNVKKSFSEGMVLRGKKSTLSSTLGEGSVVQSSTNVRHNRGQEMNGEI
jgi:hypothetical protein